MRTCPVREITPDADAIIGLFARTYERRLNGFDAPSWQLVALPDPGSMADQDAWTMGALAYVRDVRNRLEQDLVNAAWKSRHAPTPSADEPVHG
jgi:hypothetical protein